MERSWASCLGRTAVDAHGPLHRRCGLARLCHLLGQRMLEQRWGVQGAHPGLIDTQTILANRSCMC